MARFPRQEQAKPFVLASRPGERFVQLLVKAKDEADRHALLNLEGEHIEMGPAAGAGYPLERAVGRPVYLFAVGSAVAAMRPVVEALIAEPRDYGPVHFYYGVRSPSEFAYTEDLERWQQSLRTFVRTVSTASPSGWTGHGGRIQAHIPDPLDGASEAIAFVCGLPAMEKEIIQLLQDRGVPADQIHRNFG